ncbi:hypothetical protein MKZ38_000735 [Zalerion maritima]|uniref:Uncharacterized protein n=1 Tax=Zalerion maritima TaxID=339359 RepID=A0AAD5WLM5_9PEZI|nr:hypothetical protein MKZ38_000735 [Zalerion maritima]
MRTAFLLAMALLASTASASPAPIPNIPATQTSSSPTTGPTPPTAPDSLLPSATSSSSTSSVSSPSLSQVEPEQELEDRAPLAQDAPAPTPTPSIPIYGDDSGLDDAISEGLANTDPEVRSSANEWAQKYYQTTYYSCVVSGTYSHCGWHRPIIAYGNAAPPAPGAGAKGGEGMGVRAVALFLGVLAWVVGC